MRTFLILFTVVTIIYGKPQGYNYGAGLSGSTGLSDSTGVLGSSGLSGSSGLLGSTGYSGSSGPLGTSGLSSGNNGLFGSTGLSGSAGPLSGGFLSAPSNTHTVSALGGIGGSQLNVGSSGIGGGFGSSDSIGFGGLASGAGGGLSSGFISAGFNNNHQQQSAGAATILQEPLVHKQFITVSAPEDHENLEQTKHLVIGRPQKNYRVVFIKAPSSSNAKVKLSAEYAPQEEKTVIYVLSKKDNTLEVNDIATPAPTIPAKPEVFFIKYKTEDEAQHAQQQIQAEYDKIQGTSEHTDGGIAPQHSVVGILDGNTAASAAAGGSGVSGISSGSGTGVYHAAASSISPQGSISSEGSGSHTAASSVPTQGISSEEGSSSHTSATYLPPSDQH